MAFRTHQRSDGQPDREPVELAALADGSVDATRGAALLARVAASPDLAERLAVQEHAVRSARAAAAEVDAPGRLRARVDAQRNAQRAQRNGRRAQRDGRRAERERPSRRLVILGGLTAAVAVAAVALAVVFSRPDTGGERFAVALAPAGHATLTKTRSGWRIELRAPHLSRLDGGRFYEAWLRNRAGVLVPVGTFNDGRRVTLWAGVSPKNFTSLTVTREAADGDQASSGAKVLAGTVGAGG
jgi:hypothetical protein